MPIYAGAVESETMLAEIATMVQILRPVPRYDITYQIAESGVHDEKVWKSYFPFYYNWLSGNIPDEVIEKESDVIISED